MADVAALARVSGQTVSRVVNASPRVDPETRRRVEDAMERLGYRPHRAARALRTGRTQTIGLVAATLASVGNARMLQAVADAAASRSYSLVVSTLGDRRDIAGAFERLREQGVDGAIVLNEATELARGSATPRDLELVVVDSPPDARFTIVQTDHAGGARSAVEHLLGLGHEVVHHIGGPEGSFAAAERERGWREALAAAGVPEPPAVRGDWAAASGFAAAKRLVAEAPTLSAVFTANDQMALGLVRALAEAGCHVPDEVSVVGFDDVVDAADYLPPLTTVRQDFDRLGETAVAALVAGIEADGPRGLPAIPTELVIRASTRRRG
ncbi:LacI family DNA-binding transcriptional regulator [Microbacterium sp. BWT-B31]|uniref:LacI family DNA-binding transcriptional regulator n=1 Tax=Microbacterium sp. BWT-B31 TaxID=3232072 RepID=UPI0035289DF0